jgi:hypothetical protein
LTVKAKVRVRGDFAGTGCRNVADPNDSSRVVVVVVTIEVKAVQYGLLCSVYTQLTTSTWV